MISSSVSRVALRAPALALSVCTTGSASLSASAAGYGRSAGSFVTDGFLVGMEVAVTGFSVSANNVPAVITGVSALALTINGGRTIEAESAGRTISVGLPALRAWENVTMTRIPGRWYVEEEFLSGPAHQITLGPLGQVETLPLYVLKIYGVANTGPAALDAVTDALLTAYAPRTALLLSTSDSLTVRTNPAPYAGQLLQADPGWAVVVLTVPCRARSANTI